MRPTRQRGWKDTASPRVCSNKPAGSAGCGARTSPQWVALGAGMRERTVHRCESASRRLSHRRQTPFRFSRPHTCTAPPVSLPPHTRKQPSESPPSARDKQAPPGREGGAAPARRTLDGVGRGAVEQGKTRGPANENGRRSRQFGFKMPKRKTFKHARALEGLPKSIQAAVPAIWRGWT